MSCSITNPLGCVSSAASSVAGDAFSSIAHDFAKAADGTINWLWGQMGSSTSVHLGGAGFNLDASAPPPPAGTSRRASACTRYTMTRTACAGRFQRRKPRSAALLWIN